MRLWLLLLLFVPAAAACSPTLDAGPPKETLGISMDSEFVLHHGEREQRQTLTFPMPFSSPGQVHGAVRTGTHVSGILNDTTVYGGYYNPGGLCWPTWIDLHGENHDRNGWFPLRMDGPRVITDLDGTLQWLDAQGNLLGERVVAPSPQLAVSLWDGVFLAYDDHAVYRTLSGGWDVPMGGTTLHADAAVYLVGPGHATTLDERGAVLAHAVFAGDKTPQRAGDFWIHENGTHITTTQLDGGGPQTLEADARAAVYPKGTFAYQMDALRIEALWLMNETGRFQEVGIPPRPWEADSEPNTVEEMPAFGLAPLVLFWFARRI